VKDARSKALCFDNVRGIAISSILSKMFEYCLLDRVQSFLTSSNNQFGFKNVSVAIVLYILYVE